MITLAKGKENPLLLYRILDVETARRAAQNQEYVRPTLLVLPYLVWDGSSA